MSVVIQLENRSTTNLAIVIEDVLAQVNDLIFLVDFYVLDMEGEFPTGKAPFIIGKPFLKIARTKIDVHAGTLSMEFGDNVVRFNILDAMKHPIEDHSAFHIDLLADLVDDNLAEFVDDVDFPYLADYSDSYTYDPCIDSYMCCVCAAIEAYLYSECDVSIAGSEKLDHDADTPSIKSKCTNLIIAITHTYDFIEIQAVELVSSSTKLLLSIVQPSTLELKPSLSI